MCIIKHPDLIIIFLKYLSRKSSPSELQETALVVSGGI